MIAPKRLPVWSVVGLLLLCALPLAAAQETPPAGNSLLPWWREARFAMFIHWGPVSLKGTEIGWSRGAQIPIAEYDTLYQRFNPTNFNADEWMGTAKDAGMKYVVFTTKHHDGFCMWDTKQTDFNIMRSPFGRDVVKELAAACKRQGLMFGTYHSVCDWHHPDFPLTSPGGSVRRPTPNLDRYEKYLRAEVTELIQNYGPLLVMWFDVPQEFDAKRGQGLIDLCRSLQPNIIVNNRSGAAGDYDTPEQEVGKFQIHRPWETCMTICQQWAWKPNDDMKSLKQCLQTLVTCAGGDGNLLFNVGPMPDGRIEPRQVERLKEMGAWLRHYGETIYATRGGPFKPGKWGASTHKGRAIYVHAFNWPDDGLTLPPIAKKVVSAQALTGGTVGWKQSDAGIQLTLPAQDRQAIDTLIELTLDGPASEIGPVRLGGGGSLVDGKRAKASNIYQNQPGHSPDKAFDGDADTRWATDGGTKQAWLEVDLGAPKTFSRVVIDEWGPGGKRIRSFELQAHDGQNWKTFFGGSTIGADWQKKLGPVTAQRVRLNILDATDGPTINEFELRP